MAEKHLKHRPDPLAVLCPRCQAEPGERCTNYKGKGCAPHRERTQYAAPKAPVQRELFDGQEGGGPYG